MVNNIQDLRKWVESKAETVIGWEDLEKKIQAGKKIKIKIGADPTKPDLHIGHAMPLRMIRRFQDELDAEVQFLIGNFTTKIGDPTGKSRVRPKLSDNDIEKNAQTYADQVFSVLDKKKMSTWTNGEKLKSVKKCHGGVWPEMKVEEFLNLLSMVTHAKLIERDMFQKRIAENQEIYMHELMYPILQGYDSVVMESDLTIIGSDQLFNELFGRFFQEKFGIEPQAIITVPLLVGTDGKEKMSKSLGNYIGLTDSPDEMYGKTMSIPDDTILNWVKLATELDFGLFKKRMDEGENPRNLKSELAIDIVRQYYDLDIALAAAENFDRMFRDKEKPEDIPEVVINGSNKVLLIDLLFENKLISSKSDGRRLIKQGGVKIDDVRVDDENMLIGGGEEKIIKVGKRRYLKVK